MKLLIFEWLAGGGLWIDGAHPDPACTMQQQGNAMLHGLASDLMQVGHELVVPIDIRFDSLGNLKCQTPRIDSAAALRPCLCDQAIECEGIILIAPEIGGCLLECCRWMEFLQQKMLSPRSDFVQLTSDKQATAEFLLSAGIAVPPGRLLTETEVRTGEIDFPMPAVVKPVDGAGSEQIQRVVNGSEFQCPRSSAEFRIESFVSGESVSVSVLCGGDHLELLPPTGQIFDTLPIGHYIGAKYPLDPVSAERATKLAGQTMVALPPTTGYIGIDMILSADPAIPDCVVDINPRLTMSYLKLSEICEFNIASKMIEVALGLRL